MTVMGLSRNLACLTDFKRLLEKLTLYPLDLLIQFDGQIELQRDNIERIMMFHKTALGKFIAVAFCATALSACGGSKEKDGSSSELPNSNQTSVVEDSIVEDPVVEDGIEMALRTGNPAYLPNDVLALEQRIIEEIDAEQVRQVSFLERVYGDQVVDYNAVQASSLVYPQNPTTAFPLVKGNKGYSLALANEIDGQRTAAFGDNLFVRLSDGSNSTYEQASKNLLGWLMGRDAEEMDQSAKVILMLVDNGAFNDTRDWLLGRYPNWEVERCDTAGSLIECAADADLVITGSVLGDHKEVEIISAFDGFNISAKPLLYVHLHSWNTMPLTNVVVNYMGLYMPEPGNAGNYYSQDTASWADYQKMTDGADVQRYKALVERFRDNNFTITLEECIHTSSGFNTDCSASDSYEEEFNEARSLLKAMVNDLDSSGRVIFKEEGSKIEKLLILLGDHYRQSVTFPMDKSTTETRGFLRSLFADSLVYNYRAFNPVQADMGNFSRSEFEGVSLKTKTLEYTSKPYFRSAGVYALPGQTIKVTRLDDSDLETKIFVNSLRAIL